MDALISLIVSISISAVAGIVTGIKEYKNQKAKKKLKKRLAQLEQARQLPLEVTPRSEDGYQKPESHLPYV